MNLVSVIIPVYNVQKYIKQCLECFLSQTFQDFEIIVVDDESNDNTLNIVKGFKNKRIKIFSIKKGGAGAARNFGLNKAKGKWIVFFDGDDFCQNNFLELMVQKAEKFDLDVGICASCEFSEKKQRFSRHRKSHTLENVEEEAFNSAKSLKNMNPGTKETLIELVEPWNKIYRRDFLIENKIEFPNIPCSEDLPFFYEVLFNAKKISFIKEELVYTRRRPRSLSFSTNRNWKYYFEAYKMTDEITSKYIYFNEIKDVYFRRKFETYRYFFKKLGIFNKISYILRLKEEIQNANKALNEGRYSLLRALF